MEQKIKIGLFGANGHQIGNALVNNPKAEVIAVAGFSESQMTEHLKSSAIRKCVGLDELLADPDIQMVSLCSSMRSEQAGHAVRCLEAGKNVYAEKPCAMTEKDLDEIILVAKKTGKTFHEMGGTAFASPYAAMRKIVSCGQIGEVVQVYCQKSYPWGEWRAKDENVDGGLAMQVGIYNTRFVEHVAGVKIKAITMRETMLGNKQEGSCCRRAASFLMELENGGLASGVANYCCPRPPSWSKWGYETLRIFGTNGFVESINMGEIARLAVDGKKPQDIDVSESAEYLDLYLEELATGRKTIPFTIEEELSPTRWVIRAKNS